jgi:hypothetical protein
LYTVVLENQNRKFIISAPCAHLDEMNPLHDSIQVSHDSIEKWTDPEQVISAKLVYPLKSKSPYYYFNEGMKAMEEAEKNNKKNEDLRYFFQEDARPVIVVERKDKTFLLIPATSQAWRPHKSPLHVLLVWRNLR